MVILRNGGGSGGGGGTSAYDYWKAYEESMKRQYGIREPTSYTIYPPSAPSAPAPTAAPSAPSAPAAPSAPSAPSVSMPSVPTFQAPSVPDYQALAREWLSKFPLLSLPEEERAYYMQRAGEEIRPGFEAQELKLRRQAGEEELTRIQDLYGKGLIGGITIENLVDVNKRLSELIMEMGLQEEAQVGQRATEMEQMAVQNTMMAHAQRVQDWAMQYGVSAESARNTFIDQMTRVGFQAEQANAAWQRSFSEAQLGLEYEKFAWQKAGEGVPGVPDPYPYPDPIPGPDIEPGPTPYSVKYSMPYEDYLTKYPQAGTAMAYPEWEKGKKAFERKTPFWKSY